MAMKRRQFRRGEVRPSGFRSKFEEDIALDLRGRGVPFEYEARTVELELAGSRPMTKCGDCGGRKLVQRVRYTPDFFIDTPKGLVVEAKGRFTAKDRKLAKGFVAGFPDTDYAMIFQRNNKLSKASKTTYMDWCALNGIMGAVGTKVPEVWL